jgi:hypothetical protein
VRDDADSAWGPQAIDEAVEDGRSGADDVSRRHALGTSLAVVGLAATAGMATQGVAQDLRRTGETERSAALLRRRLVLRTEDLFTTSDEPLAAGERMTSAATLTGDVDGLLTSEITAVVDPNGEARFLSEQQVFALVNGTLVGTGLRRIGDDVVVMAIIGGTGAYRGARGEYTIEGSHVSNGGDGVVTYRFDIMLDAPLTER